MPSMKLKYCLKELMSKACFRKLTRLNNTMKQTLIVSSKALGKSNTLGRQSSEVRLAVPEL